MLKNNHLARYGENRDFSIIFAACVSVIFADIVASASGYLHAAADAKPPISATGCSSIPIATAGWSMKTKNQNRWQQPLQP